MAPFKNAKVLILGTGIAGLTVALKLAQSARVILVAKDLALEGATRYAQGGIASVWSKDDSFEAHKKDTLVAGDGLCHESVVDLCVGEGPSRVKELIEWGVPFTRMDTENPYGAFDLHREGGHGQRRILHADDLTGLAIARTLLERARNHPNIELFENHLAVDLITEGKLLKRWRKPGRCFGAYVLNMHTRVVQVFQSDFTVLATGGAGKVYLYTSNPDTSTGDGIAIAYRAGAKIANLEFMQFHPTCLYHPAAKNFLISEAVRGEGAVLVNNAGEDFVKKTHPMGSLAPRDVVARAIDIEMKRTGAKHVFLDATRIGADEFRKKFPNIFETCKRYGVDPTRERIPVVPAAHYCCGGVQVDLNGCTGIDNLYAIGEVACTGLHGANRLASNSLLEAVVYAHQVAMHIIPRLRDQVGIPDLPGTLPEWDVGKAVELEEQIDIAALWLEIRTLMWNYVGIVRSNKRLEAARRRLELLGEDVNTFYWNYFITKNLVELRNIHTVAKLIVASAVLRKESRGLHYTVDYSAKSSAFENDTVV